MASVRQSANLSRDAYRTQHDSPGDACNAASVHFRPSITGRTHLFDTECICDVCFRTVYSGCVTVGRGCRI